MTGKLLPVLLFLCALVAVYGIGELDAVPATGNATADAEIALNSALVGPQHPLEQVDAERQRLVRKLAVELLETYGEDIHDRAAQALLLGFRERLMADHPMMGRGLFEQAIMLAFPDHANDIFTTLAKLAAYQDWLEDNYLVLNEMTYLEREGAKWNKRLALFGADAERIWAEERQLWAKNQQTVRRTIETLDQASEYTLDETLFQLQSQLKETYGTGPEALVVNNGLIAQVYFGLGSVQEKLRQLSADDRQQQINRIRRQLGYSPAQVERLANRDQRRNERWQRGLAYMTERQKLVEQQPRDPLEPALQSLRVDYFGHEAETIAREEQNGFFRYRRPRLYGRN
ncbi:MAG: hypothetical protein R3175_08515 [Marinobacter sp.]|uniref:hypothetical protein n=1 Tax=Marinobacter sp. TaxID=50741 RepID=UPI00299E8664|nr:hypothetical protein [Marinobacter sp.]MDX1756085.1 hypothetical protein [Marinobacter sp.]